MLHCVNCQGCVVTAASHAPPNTAQRCALALKTGGQVQWLNRSSKNQS